MSVPPAAFLGGLIILTSFVISPATVKVPNTPWDEPTLVWLLACQQEAVKQQRRSSASYEKFNGE